MTRTQRNLFEVGDLIAYPSPGLNHPYKVIRRYTVRNGWHKYDLIDDELGLVIYRVGLAGCVKVGEDCSRRLVAS